MKKVLNSILFLALASNVTMSYGLGHYAQTIQLHVNSIGSTSELNAACFGTTDFFGRRHCGDGNADSYKHGPKNWFLDTRRSNHAITYTANYDLTCQPFAREGNQRTPEEEGQLHIYVTVETERIPKLIKPVISSSFTNCKILWLKAP